MSRFFIESVPVSAELGNNLNRGVEETGKVREMSLFPRGISNFRGKGKEKCSHLR